MEVLVSEVVETNSVSPSLCGPWFHLVGSYANSIRDKDGTMQFLQQPPRCFSPVMKGVSTDNRLSLSPHMLEILACLNVWLTDLYEYGDSRQSKREEASKKFTTINSALELKRPTSLSDSSGDDGNSDGD